MAKMTFSNQLREEAQEILEATYQHPFIQGIAKGDVAAEQLIHYVKQDYEYLNAMVKARGYGLTKCSNREDMEMFFRSIDYVLHSEGTAHENFCQVAGVKYTDLQGFPLSPTAHHYVNHMISAAASGTLGDVIAVTLPCPWIYLEIGRRLVTEVNPDPTHPFYDWITIYGNDSSEATTYSFRRLDEIAAHSGEEARARMRELFLISCRMEYLFFDMAYRVEEWPV